MNGKQLASNLGLYAMFAFIGACLAFVAVSTTGDVQAGTVLGLAIYSITVVMGLLRTE